MQETEQDVWTFTESAPDYARATSDLWYWSTNHDAGRGPITLYLDLIGWSDDNIGEPLYSLADASLGYIELAKLAAALTEYADRPQDVREWVDRLCSLEGS